MQATKRHFTFVRNHQAKIARIALIAGHMWQHWVTGVAGVFVHPYIKVLMTSNFPKPKRGCIRNDLVKWGAHEYI
jgi:hypothetical protein